MRSKVVVCSRSLARVACSNPAGDMEVCLLCFLSDRELWDVPIPRPEKFYGLRVFVNDREALMMRRLWPTRVCCAMGKNYFERDVSSKNC